MEGIVKNLGIVSPTPAGVWNSTTTYQQLSIVRYQNGAYIAKKASKNIAPDSANGTTYWMQLVLDGGVDIDDNLSTTSTNPVQNKVITQALNGKVDKTTTIAGIALSGNISAQSLTDALIYINTTTDLDYVMGE